MKVCDIVQFYSPLGGGVRRYIEDKSRRFAEKPDVQHIVIIPSDQNVIEYQFGSKIYHIKSLRLFGSISYRMLLNKKRIFSILDDEKPDIIEVGDPYRSAWIALQGARRLNVPVVAFYHSDFPRALGRTIRRFCGKSIETLLSAPINRYIVNLYNQMSATVVASKRLKSILNECGVSNVAHIPLGTDVTKFHPNPNASRIRKELNVGENDTLILFVGRLAREKNIRQLVRMMDDLRENPGGGGRCHLLLVGDGELRRLVERALKNHDDITWFRYCTDAKHLTAYYSAADVFIHAGVYETFGLTSLEAQACGARVVIVEGGGMEDTVEGEQPLIMARSKYHNDLADAVRRVRAVTGSQSPEQRRQRMVETFSIEKTIDRLVVLYQHLLDGKPVSEFSIENKPRVSDSTSNEPDRSALRAN